MKKILIFISIIFLHICGANAQEKIEPEILVTARNYGDSVVVRWAPNNSVLWLICNKYGYRIERVFYDEIGTEDNPQIVERYVPVRDAIFKPLSQEQMIERYKDEKHPQGMVATEFLYGDVDLRGEETGPIATMKAQEDAQDMRYAYTLLAADLDPDVADAIGLRYSFRIRDLKDIQDSSVVLRIVPLVDTSIVNVKPVIYDIDISFKNELVMTPTDVFTESGDGYIKLQWRRDNYFTAYFLEKSVDSINFVPINKTPYLTSEDTQEELESRYPEYAPSTLDSINSVGQIRPLYPRPLYSFHTYLDTVENGRTFYYRIYGVDGFGDTSKYSYIVSGVGIKEKVLDPATDVKAIQISENKVKITWKEPVNIQKLQGYFISHANTFAQENIDFITEELLPPGTKEFTHSYVKEGLYNIYFVYAVDFNGKYYPSQVATIYLKDSIKPAPPKNVKATVDSSGLCIITWDHNEEDDIEGYKVYYSMNLNQVFNQITEVPTDLNMFLDKVNVFMLNTVIYYKIIAVDVAGNHSDFSEVAVGKIPDFHPPLKPLVKSYFVGNEDVKFTFIVDINPDIKMHYFLKRKENDKWDTVKTISPKEVQNSEINVIDIELQESGVFEYCLQSEDMGGLFSVPSQVITAKINKSKNNFVVKLEGKYNSSDKIINIKWKKIDFDKDFHYVIYRNINNNGWSMYESVDKEITEFNDKQIKSATNYKYRIVPFRMGGKIGTGEEIVISVP